MQFHDRNQLVAQVQQIIDTAAQGKITLRKETQNLDFKEEAGRRGRNGEIIAGSVNNVAAADKLADEVACFANTPGGGALIVGIDDKTGEVVGTELDRDWLRQQIFNRVRVAPEICVERICGIRVLVLYIAPSVEPVSNTSGNLRWRVGDSCREVDRSEWWQYQAKQANIDPAAAASSKTIADISTGAAELLQTKLSDGSTLTRRECCLRLGVLHDTGTGVLTEAGAMLLTPLGRSALEIVTLNVPGGAASKPIQFPGHLSVLEQLEAALTQVEQLTHRAKMPVDGATETATFLLPKLAFREAILNGIIHRDWHRPEPTVIRWFTEDNTLLVRSPGTFPEGVTADHILPAQKSRYPALADAFHVLGYTERSSLGVDRMYLAQIRAGFRPPLIHECPEGYVECSLTGGEPVTAMAELMNYVYPAARRDDVRIVLLLDRLLAAPWLTPQNGLDLLQTTEPAALDNLVALGMQTMVAEEPLLVEDDGFWRVGPQLPPLMRKLQQRFPSPLNRYVPYWQADARKLQRVILAWVADVPHLRAAQIVTATGATKYAVNTALQELVTFGQIAKKGGGRSTTYTAVRGRGQA